MNGKRRLRISSGIAVAGIACAVYAWSVIGAFAHPSAVQSASALAYQYSNGQVSGAGHILGKAVAFQLSFKSDTSGAKGSCTVSEGRTRIDCVTVGSVAVVGTHVTVTGTAVHNGVRTTFTIGADDLGSGS